MKAASGVKSDEDVLLEHAATAVGNLLAGVSIVADVEVQKNRGRNSGVDLVVQVRVAGELQTAICLVKESAQPRQVRLAIQQLDAARRMREVEVAAVLVAPYLSPQSAEICREAGVGYIDFDGNCQIVLGGAYIERRVERGAKSPPRPLRSLFAPKSARALRVLLGNPGVPWRVEELAARAEISVGHVSNVRRALLDAEWANAGARGLELTQPRDLLETWGETCKRRRPSREKYYTLLHGEALDRALRAASARPEFEAESLPGTISGADWILSSFSAAERIAPFARVAALYAYVSVDGFTALSRHLQLTPALRGANVLLEPLRDPGVCIDAVTPAGPGTECHTSAIQTYLDLMREGERGEEAAAHLLSTTILPSWGSS